MYTIYKVTNKVNGKAYVGFDSNWPSRKNTHKCEALTRKNKKYPLYNAIRKYGWENFEWEVLFSSNEKSFTLNVIENKMIIEHNTHYIDGYGYNMTYGGEGTFGLKCSEQTKMKIGLSNSRCTLTEEGRIRKKDFMRINNPMYDDNIKQKHRLRLLEVKPGSKKVTDGKNVYDSIREANSFYPEIKYSTLCWYIKNNKNNWSYI